MHLDIIKAFYLPTVLIYRIPSSSGYFLSLCIWLYFLCTFVMWGHPTCLSAALSRAQICTHTKFCKLFILHIRTVHLDIIRAFYLPTVLIYHSPSSSSGYFLSLRIWFYVLCTFVMWGHQTCLSAALFRAQMCTHTKFCKLFILHIRTVHLDIIKAFYLPTVLIYRIPSSSSGYFLSLCIWLYVLCTFVMWGHPTSLSAAHF